MLCGITTADAGLVTVDTVPLGGRTHDAKLLIGLVPQDLALIEELSALDNILLFGSLYGMRAQSCDRAPARRWTSSA